MLTEWPEYSKLDWHDISKLMRKPSWIFDARSILNKQEIIDSDLISGELRDGDT